MGDTPGSQIAAAGNAEDRATPGARKANVLGSALLASAPV
jgi:hypothetical protein